MKKKNLSLFLTGALALSMLTGCGSAAATNGANADAVQETEDAAESEETDAEASEAEATDEAEAVGDNEATDEAEATEDSEAAAKQLLADLTGSYQELCPVILADEYTQTWLDDCEALVGEENAQAAYEKLSSMVSGEIYGEEAVDTYTDANGVYDCHFTEDVATFTFDDDTSTIQGYDANGSELFSHTYHYVGMEGIRGLYEYESDDENSGEFTYFCIAPDTSATTYHIELRYGSDLDQLGQYDQGAYAYWLGSGISVDCNQTMIDNCIKLFCEENLSGSAFSVCT